MKLLFVIMTIVFSVAHAEDSCKEESYSNIRSYEDVNTPVPRELVDAEITVRTKSGKEYKMSSNKFKVVPRVQQSKLTQVERRLRCTTPSDENKNLLIVGARRDNVDVQTDISTTANTSTATVKSKKDVVLDISYARRRVFSSPFLLGVGVDTNSTVKGLLGVEF